MARYIKANQKVAAYLHLENDRLKLKDGNYILWQGDMTAFAPLPMLSDTLTKIGAIALMPHEAKQEQDGTVVRPLPVATDERFIMKTVTEQPDDNTNTTDEQQDGDDNTNTTDEQQDGEGYDPAIEESETSVDGESAEQLAGEPQPEAVSDGNAGSESEQTTDETTKNE